MSELEHLTDDERGMVEAHGNPECRLCNTLKNLNATRAELAQLKAGIAGLKLHDIDWEYGEPVMRPDKHGDWIRADDLQALIGWKPSDSV